MSLEYKIDPKNPTMGISRSTLVQITSTKSRAVLFAALIFALYSASGANPVQWWANNQNIHPPDQIFNVFQWSQITPSEELIYFDCGNGMQCARLEVPMDWNDSAASAKVAIAITKIPAKVEVTDPRYGGPILINPGGPGGSGIELLYRQGLQMQQIADFSADTQPVLVQSEVLIPRYYDIIGFDPRGVNNTTPALACFPNRFERLAWNLQSHAEGLIGMSNDSVPRAWARAKALGRSCEEADGQKLGHFLNTTPVVRDMLAIIEKHGQWREKQARRWLTSPAVQCMKQPTGLCDDYSERAVIERIRWIPGREKLLYWGLSYGTVIGTTFAAMYPDRVHRIILDGVVDVPDYYNSSSRSSVQDSDKALDRLLQICFESGRREKCGLFDPKGPEEIKAKLFSIIDNIKETPLPTMSSTTQGPQIITASDVDMALHLALYKPLKSAKQLFHAFHNLTLGDASWLADFKRSSMVSDIAEHPESCRDASPWTPECQTSGIFDETGSLGIECSDGEDIQDWSQETFNEYWALLRNYSKVMGTRKAATKLMCTQWRLRPAWRYTGPFEAETQHPILLIGNTLDPTTPLNNAHKIARGFPGSVVLQHDAIGHCSNAAPSLCTAKVVRRYFQTGELPPKNAFCEVDEIPFVGSTSYFPNAQRSPEEILLWEASRRMAMQ